MSPYVCGIFVTGFMTCIIFCRLAFSCSSSESSETFRLRDAFFGDAAALAMIFAMRFILGSGSRISGALVAS